MKFKLQMEVLTQPPTRLPKTILLNSGLTTQIRSELKYAFEDGQELIFRSGVGGETKEETIIVNKQLPSECYSKEIMFLGSVEILEW